MVPFRPGLSSLLALAIAAQAAAGLEEKLQDILARYESGAADAKDFEIQESEANEYLRSDAALPDGIESPWVRFEEELTIVGATVDLEKFRANLPSSMILQLLRGRVPVEATARVSGEKGVGKIDLERVVLGGVDLPPSLVASMASGEGASNFLPPGFRLGEPFDLPYNLESIRCRTGVAQVRQQGSSTAE